MIFHIVAKESWETARHCGEYRGDTLASEGFIHCSTSEQVLKVANSRFWGRADLLILLIDPKLVAAKIKFEEGEPGQLFPHIYGALNLDAVVDCVEFPACVDGSFVLPEIVREALRHKPKAGVGRYFGAVFSILVLVGLWALLLQVDLGVFGKGDFLQYWAGGKLFLSGGNPYDLTQMREAEAPYNLAPITILVWNPPLIFPFVAPLSLLGFDAAAVLWLVLMCVAFAGALSLLFSCQALHSRARGAMALRIVFLLSFYPLALSLYYGQSSPLLLVGFAGFVALFLRPEGTSFATFEAGFMLALTALKPHLLYLVYLWLFVRAWHLKSWRTVVGFACGVGGLALLALSLRSDIFNLYLAAISTPPIYWKTPTLGSWLQEFSDIQETWVRMLPTVLFAAAALFVFSRRRSFLERKEVLFVLTPLSLLTAPYGWHFDHVLLLPVALWCIARVDQLDQRALWPVWLVLLANFAVLLTPSGLPMHYLIWYSVLFLVAAIFTVAPLVRASEGGPTSSRLAHQD